MLSKVNQLKSVKSKLTLYFRFLFTYFVSLQSSIEQDKHTVLFDTNVRIHFQGYFLYI